MRIRFFHWLDILLVSDPEEIRWLNQHPDIVRPLDSSAGLLQRWMNRRLLQDLRFECGVLPVFLPRTDLLRARRQLELTQKLDEPLSAESDPALESLASYLSKGEGDSSIGALVQEWCGKLLSPRYRASATSYEAGRLIAGWPSAPFWKTMRARRRGSLESAKAELSRAAEGDLHCVHATSIGMENMTRSLRTMRKLAEQKGFGALSSDAVMSRCLHAPPALLRACEGEVHAPFLSRPLQRRSIVVFLLARAYRKSGDPGVAFLEGTWSACPARQIIPQTLLAPARQILPELAKKAWQTMQKPEAKNGASKEKSKWAKLQG